MRTGYPAFLCLMISAVIHGQDAPPNEFVTLGTMGGPVGSPTREQPANALIVGEAVYLVDAGDGAASGLRRIGYQMPALRGVFLSHLHFDHSGGMLAVLGRRAQVEVPGPLPIFGPPGTQHLVEGLLTGMEPILAAALGVPGESWGASIEVTEMTHADRIELDGMTVTVAENSHFDIPGGRMEGEGYISLSLRFDLPNRTIVYTGDTGPSAAVEALAEGADLLICEAMDMDLTMENTARARPDWSQDQLRALEEHLRTHHLTPAQAGMLAANAGVGELVITHFNPSLDRPEQVEMYKNEVSRYFHGEITFADDLDRF